MDEGKNKLKGVLVCVCVCVCVNACVCVCARARVCVLCSSENVSLVSLTNDDENRIEHVRR